MTTPKSALQAKDWVKAVKLQYLHVECWGSNLPPCAFESSSLPLSYTPTPLGCICCSLQQTGGGPDPPLHSHHALIILLTAFSTCVVIAWSLFFVLKFIGKSGEFII